MTVCVIVNSHFQWEMKPDFVSSGRSVSNLKAHLILVTKYRRKVINQEMLSRLGEIVENLCEKWDCKLIEFNGEEDHVHLLFQYYPQLDLSKFVTNIKSISSRRLRSEYTEIISKTYYKKPVFWSESYFIASCGGVSVSVLRKYIDNQSQPES